MEDIYVKVSLDDRILRVSDAREYFKGCINGWQSFALAHNFDWKLVVRHGLYASQLLETKDAMAVELVTWYYKEKL